MSTIKQVERIIKILQRLSLTREVTVNQLYGYFEQKVPKRTLQRDLIEISAAEIPLQTKPGRGKELIWYIDKSYLKFIPETIGSRELLASYFLERLGAVARGTKLEKDICSLLKKAKQFIDPNIFRSLPKFDASDELFGATFMGYIDYAPFSDVIDTIVTAASNSQRCVVNYKVTWKKKTSEFEIDPYLLLYHKGALYALCHTPKHENFIFLPVQRIRNITQTGATFKRDKNFSLEDLRKNRFGIFGNEGLKPQEVSLRFDKRLADIVAERVWHPTQQLTRHKNGSLTLKMTTVVSDELRSWVGSWLEAVTVIKPKNLLKTRDQIGH